MQMLWNIVIALGGVAVGALAAVVLLRLRLQSLLEGAAARGSADLATELAAQAERGRLQQAQLLQARQEALQAQAALDALRVALDEARQARTEAATEAARVPALQAQAARLSLQLRLSEEELHRLTPRRRPRRGP